MRVRYQKGTDWRALPVNYEGEQDLLALSYNNWNDYGFNTTLNATIFIKAERLLDFSLKVLIDGQSFSAEYLNSLIDQGWDGFFPIPNCTYISVPTDIDMYEILNEAIEAADTVQVLTQIRDAGYLKNLTVDPSVNNFLQKEGFENSLLREAGSKKAFSDGWKLFSLAKVSSIDDFTLNLLTRSNRSIPIEFRFKSALLPYDINVLIGPNGIGKSYCLKSLVEYWLGIGCGDKKLLEAMNHLPFDIAPKLSRLVLVSYSPFEEFALDLFSANLVDKQAYKYFGFRQNMGQENEIRIGISRVLPSIDSIKSLLKAFSDDNKFSFMSTWIGKIETINAVLKSTIGYEELAFAINDSSIQQYDFSSITEHLVFVNNKYYLLANSNNYLKLKTIDLNTIINFNEGVVFIKNGEKVELSSGQRLFCYIVINVIGEIKQDSLIVIDEPELFLHPTLEIKFISMLKDVLSAFSSRAILATHSLAIVREIPANCVHVFREMEDGLDVVHPPFETFGGDMQRISTYVFGDKSISKPFDEWIEKKLEEFGNIDALIKALGKELNEEILIKLLNTGGPDGN